jgi:hypothetical protein
MVRHSITPQFQHYLVVGSFCVFCPSHAFFATQELTNLTTISRVRPKTLKTRDCRRLLAAVSLDSVIGAEVVEAQVGAQGE